MCMSGRQLQPSHQARHAHPCASADTLCRCAGQLSLCCATAKRGRNRAKPHSCGPAAQEGRVTRDTYYQRGALPEFLPGSPVISPPCRHVLPACRHVAAVIGAAASAVVRLHPRCDAAADYLQSSTYRAGQPARCCAVCAPTAQGSNPTAAGQCKPLNLPQTRYRRSLGSTGIGGGKT